MLLSKLKLVFSSAVLLGYAALGIVAFVLFFTDRITDLETILVLSPYTAIAGGAKALFDNVAFNSQGDSVYGFEGKELRLFFKSLVDEVNNRFKSTKSTIYLIRVQDYYSIRAQIKKGLAPNECPLAEELCARFDELFFSTATAVIGDVATESDVLFYIRRIGSWLEENRTFEPEAKLPNTSTFIILAIGFAYPLSGIFLLLAIALTEKKGLSPEDIGLIAGLISGLFASYWSSTTNKLSGQGD